jgi:hypothetical protein
MSPHYIQSTPPREQNHPEPILIEPVQNTNVSKYETKLAQSAMKLKNPFVIPFPAHKNPDQRLSSQKKRTYIEYQGIIETDNSMLGLVKMTATNEAFLVYEGESLVEFGLEIHKITAKNLTYSKDGIEAVISLGGI